MRHVMIDLETLGTGKEAAILQLAAVDFDPLRGRLGGELNIHIALGSNLALGRTVDPGAFVWWLEQDEDARQALARGQQNATDLPTALLSLDEFCQHSSGRRVLGSRPQEVEGVWSHGAVFDIPIVETAFATCGMAPPWSYRVARDTRTLFDVAEQASGQKVGDKVSANPLKHCALSDARWQAEAVVAAYGMLGIRP